MTWAWMETSRAETGSSATRKSGFTARARAIPTLWRADAVERQGMSDHRADLLSGIQAGVGILEDDLHPLPEAAHLFLREL